MNSPGTRLKALRTSAGYETAIAAVQAFGWNYPTYASHENGSRGVPTGAAEKYARAFHSTAQYILFGTSEAEGLQNWRPFAPTIAQIEQGTFRETKFFEPPLQSQVPAVAHQGTAQRRQYSLLVAGGAVQFGFECDLYIVCAELDPADTLDVGQIVHIVTQRSGLYGHSLAEVTKNQDGQVELDIFDARSGKKRGSTTKAGGSLGVSIHGRVAALFTPMS